jgi:hypothetical protein
LLLLLLLLLLVMMMVKIMLVLQHVPPVWRWIERARGRGRLMEGLPAFAGDTIVGPQSDGDLRLISFVGAVDGRPRQAPRSPREALGSTHRRPVSLGKE